MTGGELALGCTWTALCILLGALICCPIAYAYGRKRAAEDAEDAVTAATIDEWKGLPDEDARPAPPWPVPPAQAPRTGPGKHRHPAGPPRHAGLPAAGYLPAEPSPWAATMTLPAPVQVPPWEQPEPETQVLEPTAVLPPDSLTDTAWTRRMAADMDAWIAEHIGATDSTLKAITK